MILPINEYDIYDLSTYYKSMLSDKIKSPNIDPKNTIMIDLIGKIHSLVISKYKTKTEFEDYFKCKQPIVKLNISDPPCEYCLVRSCCIMYIPDCIKLYDYIYDVAIKYFDKFIKEDNNIKC